jgi:glycosyltransferase involved in cell wall biosynthesis
MGRDAAVRSSGPPERGVVRVSYGHASIGGPDQPVVGGLVKLQELQQLYPHDPRGFSVLYLVTSNLPDDAVSLARAARDKGARVVVNQNGVAYRGWYGEGWEAVNEPMVALLGLAAHVFYQSRFCRESADRFLGTRTGPSEVLFNAVDTARFRPAQPLGDRQGLTLLLGGTQTVRYRVEVALQVTALVAAVSPHVKLIVAGRLRWNGDEAASHRAVEAQVRALGLEGRVDLVGPYTQADAPALYQRADVLLHTKYNDPCPAVVLEGLASGLPVVYSASGGVPELVGSDAGIGVPAVLDWDRDHPPDPRRLADAVLGVARDRERMSQCARRRALERFDIVPWRQRHQQIFETLVA